MLAKKVRTDEERRIDENLQRVRLVGRMGYARFLEIVEGEVLRRTKADPKYVAPVSVDEAALLVHETTLIESPDHRELGKAKDSLS